MIKLAESSGTVIYENENKLYITKKTAQWTVTARFVTGLLAFILLANGLLQLFITDIQPDMKPPLGVIFLGLGILFTFIFWRIIVYRKKINSSPFDQSKSICIIDLAANTLLDAHQNLLAPLVQVHLLRKMQLTSSSPELILQWNSNTLVIVQGNPFSGGIAAVEKILISKGIQRR